MKTWLAVLLRLLVCAVVTIILWWMGARWLGVSFDPDGPVEAFTTVGWVVFIGLAWAIILGLPAFDWAVERLVGGLYTPGDSQFHVHPEFSIAEGHAAVGRYREAVDQFRNDIEKYPEEVTPHVRIAEISIEQLGEIDTGIAELQIALTKARSEDAFVLVAHRLADAYIERKHDVPAGVAVLDEILQRYPHSKHAIGARHRIQSLTEG